MHRNTRNDRERDDDGTERIEELRMHESPGSASWKYLNPCRSLKSYCSRKDSNSIKYHSRSTRDQSHGFIINPENWWYNCWTQFVLIWAVYSFFTPLEFAFFRGLSENLLLLDIAGQFTFLIDIVVYFFIGYRDPSSYCLVYNPNLIALRYLKSRFVVDLLACLPWDIIYKIHNAIGDISVLCNIPEPCTIQVAAISKLLRKDKKAPLEIVEIYFSDGHNIINNLLKMMEICNDYDILLKRSQILEKRITKDNCDNGWPKAFFGKIHSCSSILLEDGCKILDPIVIMDGQKHFLASDKQLKRNEYWY